MDGQADWPTGWPGQSRKTNKKKKKVSFKTDMLHPSFCTCIVFCVFCFFGFRISWKWAVLLADCLSWLARPVGRVDGQAHWATGWPGQSLKTKKTTKKNNSFHQNKYATASQLPYMSCFFGFLVFRFTDFVEVGCASCSLPKLAG